MVKRICPKCNDVFDRKSNYEFHINRKFDCLQNKINLHTQFNQSDILNQTNIKDNLSLCQIVPFCAEIVPNRAELSTNNKKIQNSTINFKHKNILINENNVSTITNITKEIKEIKEIKETNKINKSNDFCCYYCNKKYSSNSTFIRHLKINCKVKKENDYEKENIFKILLNNDKQYKKELKYHKEEIKLHKNEVNELKITNTSLMDKIDKLILSNSTTKIIN